MLLVSEADLPYCADDQNVIVVKDPYVAYAILAQLMDTTPKPAADIAQSAVISASALLGKNVSIGANAVIEDGVIGDDVCIGAGCLLVKMPKSVQEQNYGQMYRFITMLRLAKIA